MALGACGSGPENRYLLEAPAAPTIVPVRISTVELRDVSLPSYATVSEILVQAPDGSVQRVSGAIWADDPVRAVTIALAAALDQGTTATVAAEPWPLQSRPAVRLDVRVARMLARNDGQFELSGQYAVAAPERAIRESVEPFSIMVPLADTSPASVAAAAGTSITQLSRDIAARLAR